MKEDLQRIEFRKAIPEDVGLLVRTRIEVLRAANGLTEGADMSKVEKQSRDYYEKALADETHTALLVFDQGQFIGSGGISYYRVMPTYHNPTGRKAYIMNMYTRPEYATAAGRPLYERYGFSGMKDEMELIL